MFAAVRPICLPDPAQDYENVIALVTGWGRNSTFGPQSNILQDVFVTTITNSQCRSSWGNNYITENMICAEAAGWGPCHGDSGGPLAVLGQDGSYSQIGIVSWASSNCARQEWPGVYSRLTALLPWITKTIHGKKKLFYSHISFLALPLTSFNPTGNHQGKY